MKNFKRFIVISTVMMLLLSCGDNDNEINFYNSEFRKGLWINEDKSDTLEFIDDLTLIRKGTLYSQEKYSYLIIDAELEITLSHQNEEFKSQHPILEADNNRVRLGNMYITNGFTENSVIYYKD